MANKISVIIDVAHAQATAGLKTFRTAVADADGTVNKAKAGMTAAFGSIRLGAVALGAAAGAALYKTGQAASNLEESVNAVNVTFGEAAEGVLELGENAAKSVGLSSTEFNGLAVQFSSFATTVAGEGGNVVSTLDDLTVRAADFASVMNLDVAEAARVFQSGLAGETEPLKKFGIDLSAAAVEAFAYANGIAETGKQLTETQKVQARYGLLMEQTAKTHGDFANTADGAANQQRVLTAELKDAQAAIGKGVLPAMTSLVTILGNVVEVAGPLITKLGQIAEAASEVVFATGDTSESMKALVDVASDTEAGMADIANSFSDLVEGNSEAQSRLTKTGKVLEMLVNPAIDSSDERLRLMRKSFDDLAKQSPEAATAVVDSLQAVVNASKKGNDAAQDYADSYKLTQDVVNEFAAAIPKATRATEDLGEATEDAAGHIRTFNADTIAAKEVQEDAEQATKNWHASLEAMLGTINAEQAWLSLQDKITQYTADMYAAGAGTDEHRMAVLELQEEMLTYVGNLEGIPIEKKTEIVALIDQEAWEAAELALKKLEKSRFPVYTPRVGGGAQYFHEGGVVQGPRGSEQLAVLKAGETVLPTHKSGSAGVAGVAGGMGGGVTVHINGGLISRQTVMELEQMLRQLGDERK